ncbi:alpha/beta hydrolase [Pedobacter boryungensis]|uniref:Alpha/beta hydrolase n=1 Tax=Pedobacter boryungensis TaxID=869962 RepID=A0ABX2DAA0_9SPHI|nr:alpha/beta hydrolase-fold protein [Pedobacter boryungensis]NQX30246.1 alpha/beta hydrolase [Pedobacter boryungensis]
MKWIYFFVIFISSFLVVNAQVKVRFELQNIPQSKDTIAEYFVAGNFNNWKPNDPEYQFSKRNSLTYVLEKQLSINVYEYKITRGSWEKVETNSKGNAIGNRSLNLKKDTIVKISVSNFADQFKKELPKHTSSVNVHIIDTAFLIPQLATKRRVWIYLPPSYASSTKKYPVLYMHDGQNLFDQLTSGYGEWGVDELLDSLSAKGQEEFIVVGIDHGGSERLKEYNPYDSEYGKGKGKDYVDFLVHNLKPFIDQHYRTEKDAKNTAIAGSSMGGLISMYAIATYPKVFGKAGIFSPAFWIGKTIETDVQNAFKNLNGSKIYLVAGDLESKTMISDMKNVFQLLNPTGKNKNIRVVEKADGKHSEWFWHREFVDFYKFISN